MATLRFKALAEITSREREFIECKESGKKISELFEQNIFNDGQMRKYLPEQVYELVRKAIDQGRRIDRNIANEVALGMRNWAMDRGATHYTHWFQPLNDSTAEKHDSFFEIDQQGGSFENFTGNLLVQQEPDASSFPNGGLRNTFEARGYSAWDPSSPAFLVGNTLCIPSIFISYTGEALDFKTPLLKSLNALDKAATEVCELFGEKVEKVITTLGWEQEYFLVDKALFEARPDLVQTGRTLMGHTAAKDQQLSDHYWGTIPERVICFMKEFEEESYKLGIPIKTRHNEVAPNQFECAPIYEEANIANDHNTLLMSTMRRVAGRHNLKVLFHEKPFMGVNGSGKHCNWSLATDKGINLLSPGKTPRTNMQFLAFFVSAIKATNDYGSLLMSTIATATNYHRLGGHEAPPAILSVFCGSTMSRVLDNIAAHSDTESLSPDSEIEKKFDLLKIPEIIFDNTDRNRTSPFAFTGNRFEFRALGSSSNCALPLIVLNTAMAKQLVEFKEGVTKLEERGVERPRALLHMIRQYILKSSNVRFDGNGYSDEWKAEAKRRGLKEITNIPEALKEYISEDTISLFESIGTLNSSELNARYGVRNETYIKKVQIESRVVGDLAANHIIPTAIKYQNVLLENAMGLKEVFPEEYEQMASEELKTIKEITEHVKFIREHARKMTTARRKWNRSEDIIERALGYEKEVRPYIDEIRVHIDELEMIVDDELWPLPKYRELMNLN